ncbi:MAG TPA: hypothetical protein VGL77_15040 [Armatimonadota bacterium]|jgi:hypothetical protein
MFNMCSVISTHDDDGDEVFDRIPWRALGIILCLLAAALYGTLITRHALTQWHTADQDEYLGLAGPIAEAAEGQLADDPQGGLQPLAGMLSPLFTDEVNLAAIRIWNPQGQLTGEMTRQAPGTLQTTGGLPDLGLRAAVTAQGPYLTRQNRLDTIAQLQLMESEQNDVMEQIDAAAQRKVTATVRETFYLPEDHILELAQTLAAQQDDILGTDTITDINAVLDALTLDDDTALSQALEACDKVSGDLTLALTEYRATTQELPALPTGLAATAPPPASWWSRCWPVVYGRRILIPLYTPGADDQVIVPAGFAEMLFFHRPAEILALLGWRMAPPLGLLLCVILLLCLRPRRRKTPPQHTAVERTALAG